MLLRKIQKKTQYSVGIIHLNSPESYNIIDDNMIKEIKDAFFELEQNPHIKIIFIGGDIQTSSSGKNILSAGFDLKKYPERLDLAQNNPEKLKKILSNNIELFDMLEKSQKPVVIGINGLISGFLFELALCCDVILLSESAKMVLNEVNIGIMPGYGSIYRLLNLVGKNKTFEIVAGGKTIDAAEAKSLNIASEIYSDNFFSEKTLEYCQKLAEKPSTSLALIKKTLNQIVFNQNIKDFQLNNFIEAVQTENAKEGINAFLEKRNAVFK